MSPAPLAGKVLLVEDNARLAASIRDYLQKHQVEVHVEGDGLAAAARIERLRPDLVILDLMLPGKDGLAICRELRRTDRTPVLMLTAKGEDIDQVLGLEMGADDYVVKPVEPRVLLARIEAILRRARRRKRSSPQAGWRSTPGAAARPSPAGPSSSPRATSTSCGCSPRGRAASSPATRSCAWCGASTTTGSTAPSTRASAACGASCTRREGRSR